MTLKSDRDYVIDYHNGSNKPPYYLIQKYDSQLFFLSMRYIRRAVVAKDLLSECMLEYIETPVKRRKKKLWLTKDKESAYPSLSVLVRNRSIDEFRRHKEVIVDTGNTDDMVPTLNGSLHVDDFIIDYMYRDIYEKLLLSMQREEKIEDANFWQQWRLFGKGRLKELAESMNMTTDEARKIKQRIIRYIKRLDLK